MRTPGFLLYRGLSKLNRQPIVCIASLDSRNPKTGPEIQTWILPDAGEDPVAAARSGGFKSVCGACPLAPEVQPDGSHKLGPCYVNLIFGPLSAYRAYERHSYPLYDPALHSRYLAGRMLRLGSYGDPAAVPLYVWRPLLSLVSSWTGYTHAWRTCHPSYRHILMASVDTPAQYQLARSRGWRTYRVRLPEEPLLPGEFVCPASLEANHRLTCIQCKACNGARPSPRAASPAIVFHASTAAGNWKLKLYRTLRANLEVQEPSGRIPLPLT